MPRRTRGDQAVEIVPPLLGMVFLFLLIVPGGRLLIPIIGSILFGSIGLAILALAVFFFRRVWSRSSQSNQTSFSQSSAREEKQLVSSMPAQITTRQLFERLRIVDWYQFEKIIAIVYRKAGFHVDRRGGANPDGGIDILITGSAREKVAIQCKHWKTRDVGVKTIREFLGALKDAGIHKGIVITLRGYTGEAKQLAERNGIGLLNETGLAELFQSTQTQFDPEVLSLLNETRKLCPKCEHELGLRTAKKGAKLGSQFWGCSNFPRCRFTMPRA
jgi:restriction system protein